MTEVYKFQKLRVYQLALDYVDAHFLGHSLRSYLESVACLDVIERRNYLLAEELEFTRDLGHQLFVKLQAFRKSLRK